MFPFVRDSDFEIERLRTFSAQVSAHRRSNSAFSQQLRENRVAWAKVWNEELVPLLYLADGLGLRGSDMARLMPEGDPVDLQLVGGGHRRSIQVTIADLVWHNSSLSPGHLRAVKFKQLATGYAWGGANYERDRRGKIGSKPHARSPEEDWAACHDGLVAALTRKCTHDGSGKALLIFARDFANHLIDADVSLTIGQAVAEAPTTSFDELFVVDTRVFWRS